MKKYITITLLLFVSLSFGQRKYTADRYFKEFAYVKSAELYALSKYHVTDTNKLNLKVADIYSMMFKNNDKLKISKFGLKPTLKKV